MNRHQNKENNPNWKGGLPHCLDCNKQLTNYNARHCQECRPKHLTGKDAPMFGRKENKNPAYIDGRSLKKKYCKDCRIEIKNYYAIYCKKHANQHSLLKRLENHKSMKGKNNPMFGQKEHLPKWGKYKKTWMRSSWEVKYAQYLDKNNIKWQYEPKAFDLGESTYRPDFYLPRFNLYIEVKGWWKYNAKCKFNLFKRLFPNKKIKVLYKKDLIQLGVL